MNTSKWSSLTVLLETHISKNVRLLFPPTLVNYVFVSSLSVFPLIAVGISLGITRLSGYGDGDW